MKRLTAVDVESKWQMKRHSRNLIIMDGEGRID